MKPSLPHTGVNIEAKLVLALSSGVSVSGTRTENEADISQTDALGRTSRFDREYTSENYAITLRQPLFRRDAWVRHDQAQTRANYMKNFDLMTNFNPFETIRLYINAIKYDYIGMEIPLSNLVGNAMLFMPMAVFLPCLFAPMRKLWLFALTMALALVAVEAAH